MSVRVEGAVAHLEGNWTTGCVVFNMELLTISLDQLESDGKSCLWINCCQVEAVDTSGLQLLDVWVGCARLRGIEPKLVNVTDGMLRSIHELGFSHLFYDSYLDVPC